MATFGKITTGASASTFAVDHKFATKYALTENGDVSSMLLYCCNDSEAGTVTARCSIYADSGGEPGALLGTTQEHEVTSGAYSWEVFNFTTPVALTAGSYWLCLNTAHTGARFLAVRYDSVAGSNRNNADTYAGGDANPFGATSTDVYELCVQATYTASGFMSLGRFAGPQQLTGSAATVYTAPASGARIDNIHVSNPSGAPVGFTFSVGTDAAASRMWDAYQVPAGAVVEWNVYLVLGAGEIIQAFASTGGVLDLTLDGTAYATATQTSVAEVSLSAGSAPTSRTLHSLHVRARTTAGAGTIRMALYEGAVNITDTSPGYLQTASLTTSLADYSLPIADADAAAIGSYANLGVRFWGYAAGGGAIVYEVDQIWLETPPTS